MEPERLNKLLDTKTGLTLDVLIVLLLIPAHVVGQDAYILVVGLIAYLLLALWLPLPESRDVAAIKSRGSFLSRYALLLFIAAGAVVVPTLNNVKERARSPVQDDGFSATNINLSDSALQTELALDYLTRGKNPYVERYEDTPLRFYQWWDVGDPDWKDPAFEYFVYLPGNLLLSFPIFAGSMQFGIHYDQRVIYLIFYVLLLLVLPHLVKSAAIALSLVAAVGLNPLFTNATILGMNDVLAVFGLVLSILALTRSRLLMAAFFLGLACVLKQYTWFFVPFFLLYVWQNTPIDRRLRQVALSIAIIGGLFLLVIGPFFFWDPLALYTDTIAFPAGRTEYLYPIRGFTIGRMLMGAGFIETFVSPFPFQILQLIVGLPLLLLLLRYQSKQSLAVLPLTAAIFILVIGFLSRFFHENYVGVVITLAVIGILLSLSNEFESSQPSIT